MLQRAPRHEGAGADGKELVRVSREVSMANEKERVTVSVQELALANSLTLTALVEILEERGLIQQAEVLERVKIIRDRRRPRGKSSQF